MRTDIPQEVGMHVFERAGLGKAPFRVTGFSQCIFKAASDAPAQPGTSCDYCGTGIMNVCHITGSDSSKFKVGCDCVNKTGDSGLIRGYKSSPEYRQHQRELRQLKARQVHQRLFDLLQDQTVQANLSEKPHPSSWFSSQGKTMLDWANFVLRSGGDSSRASLAKTLNQEEK